MARPVGTFSKGMVKMPVNKDTPQKAQDRSLMKVDAQDVTHRVHQLGMGCLSEKTK